jgi:hypothetical protein
MTDGVPDPATPTGGHPEPDADGLVRAGEAFGIGNEFTGVLVRKVWTKQGERLEICVPRDGRRILLDAMQLEILTSQEPERFSELFAIALDAHPGGES